MDTSANGAEEQALGDLARFPILTKDVGYTTTAGATGGAPGLAPLGQIVEGAIRDVLGWRPKTNDPKNFLVALNQSFALKETEGHTIWAWTSRTYAVQADANALTGAQASIYYRTRTAVDQILPLLDGLYALNPAADPQDMEAMRAIVRSNLQELVNDLGMVGGPAVWSIDARCQALLDVNPEDKARSLIDPEAVGGQLGVLGERFGLTRDLVNTIAEEQNLTNFYIVVNYIDTLMLSWASDREFFLNRPGTDVFLGTQQVLLTQQLAVLAESVQEAYFVLDSVLLGPAERQATLLDLPGEAGITIASLLEAVDYLASQEGPRLLQDGGKDGVRALRPTVEKLRDLLQKVFNLSRGRSSNPTRAFHSERAQNTFDELYQQLRKLDSLIKQVRRLPRPAITAVVPKEEVGGQTIWLSVIGANLLDITRVRLTRKPSAGEVHATPVAGASDLVALVGTDIRVALSQFKATQPLALSRNISVEFVNSNPGADSVKIEDITIRRLILEARDLVPISPSEVRAQFALPTVDYDQRWNLVVTNEEASVDWKQGGFTILASPARGRGSSSAPSAPSAGSPAPSTPTPPALGLSPSVMEKPASAALQVMGSGIQPGATIELRSHGPGKKSIEPAGPVTYTAFSARQALLAASFNLESIGTSKWHVIVINPDKSELSAGVLEIKR